MLLCHLLGHVPALGIQRNQGFAFSRCLRCCHDMIRSEEVAPPPDGHSQPWKRVPSGFRVKRTGDGGRSPKAMAQLLRLRTRSGMVDLLRIGAATFFWGTRDALRPRPKRTRVLRLAAS